MRLRRRGREYEDEAFEETPSPEEERRKHTLDGDGEEKLEAVVSPSDDEKRADLLVHGFGTRGLSAWLTLL